MSEDLVTDEVQKHVSSAVPKGPAERVASGPPTMKITSVTIKNFKAIEETTVPLSDFTVIVGTNGSGKSSILQALHWILQSGRNLSVSAERTDKGSTLSEIEAT